MSMETLGNFGCHDGVSNGGGNDDGVDNGRAPIAAMAVALMTPAMLEGVAAAALLIKPLLPTADAHNAGNQKRQGWQRCW